MRIILTDKELDNGVFPSDIVVKKVNIKSLEDYDNSSEVVAIAGSRAMAIKAEKMSFPGLKLFQLTSAGFDGVPCKEFADKKVAVANAGSVYSVPIAETVIFGILSYAKRLHNNPNNRHFKLRRNYHTITEIQGKSILIMGAGNIGTAVADRLSGFGAIIDGYDPFCPDKRQYRKIIRSREELLGSIGYYDYIVTTLPDNDDTRGFINAELFFAMKKSVVIVNVGRKAVFNENDFYYALKRKRVGGAILDMFEVIPNPIQNKFRRLGNVVVLPGVAAISQEVNERLKIHMTNNILAVLNGSPIMCVINGVK